MIVTDIETAFVERSLQNAGLPFSKGQPRMETLTKLANSGQRSHSKFLRQMQIAFEVTAPLYWMSEFDTYKIGVTRMSDSTMHTLLKRNLETTDFVATSDNAVINKLITEAIHNIELIKKYSWQTDNEKLISIKKILPSSFKYHSYITMNYEVLRTMYHDRKNHRVPEWQEFLYAFKDIPYFKEFIVGDVK